MKLTAQLFWVLVSPIAFASPLQLDVNVHLDNEAPTTTRVKDRPLCQLATTSSSTALPTVDLGYEIHQASPSEENQTYYAFENIPFAKQPVGKLRFKKAEPFAYEDYPDEPKVNDGSKTVVCPQKQVGWIPHAAEFSQQLYNPLLELDSKFAKAYGPDDYPKMPSDDTIPHQSEECLVLDVFVPKRLFDDTNQPLRPVIVSFHGGGFIFGSKTINGGPAGLLKAAGENGIEGDVIIVSANYRLGAFGWLAGEGFTNGGGYENAGLSDQKLALDWVFDHINRFGGDPYSVTALGESAGASSILHHLTAYGFSRERQSPARFSKAILQSPAFFPQVSPNQMNKTYHDFLDAVGVDSFKKLQDADSADLMKANSRTTYYSPYGTFTYGPVVSERKIAESYIQVPPSLKMQTGVWFSYVPVMIANNRREGSLFTPPWIRNEEALAKYIKGIYPAMTDESFEEFAKLYPVPQTKKVLGVTVPTTGKERFLYAAAGFGDLGVDCNSYILNKKTDEKNYRYFYRLYPGIHGQDVGATWYPEAGPQLTDPLFNPQKQSERLQRWITCFAKDDDNNPNCAKKDDDKEFKPIKDGSMWIGTGAVVLNKTGDRIPDEYYEMSKLAGSLPSDDVCGFWNSAPYWEADPEIKAIMSGLRIQGGSANEL